MLSPSQISRGPGLLLPPASPMLDGEPPVCSPHLSQAWGMYAGIAAGQTGTILRRSCQHVTETGSSMLKRAPEQGPWPTGSEAYSGKQSLIPSSAMELGPSCSPPPPPRFPCMQSGENDLDLDFPFLSVRCLLSHLTAGLLSALCISCLLPHIVTSLFLARECKRSLGPRRPASRMCSGQHVSKPSPRSRCMSVLPPLPAQPALSRRGEACSQ